VSTWTSGDTYDDALARYRREGASRADDAALMAAFCEHDIQQLVGAVSPRFGVVGCSEAWHADT
jgi:hypothetical protein